VFCRNILSYDFSFGVFVLYRLDDILWLCLLYIAVNIGRLNMQLSQVVAQTELLFALNWEIFFLQSDAHY